MPTLQQIMQAKADLKKKKLAEMVNTSKDRFTISKMVGLMKASTEPSRSPATSIVNEEGEELVLQDLDAKKVAIDKKNKTLAIIGGIVLIGGLGFLAYWLIKKK